LKAMLPRRIENRGMRICYVADGASIHTQRWVNYFARKGHEIHLVCWKLMPGYDENIHIHLLTRLAPKIWAVSQYLSFLFWILQVRRLVRKIKPDIVDGHFITVYGFLAACSGFHPLVVSAWGSDVLIYPRQSPLWKFSIRYALKRADAVICDSETVKTGLVELGANPRKIKKVFWGVDTQQFNPRWRNEEIKSQLSISGAPVVISLRNFKTVYNVEILIRAIPLVLDRALETKFIVAGDGVQRDYLMNLAISLGVSDVVRFVGLLAHDELPRYLASSDVYVSTSLSDSTSLSLQEAMACELAPVVTDLPANREWVIDAENGFIVPTNDAQALADKIVYLIKNRGVREEFGKQGRKIIQEKAEYQKEMAKVEKIYQGLTSKIA
jgi:glycosyltransferase involved in cell wall biosynthesis